MTNRLRSLWLMPLTIHFSNKQRVAKIATSKWRGQLGTLALGVIDNLKTMPAKHLSYAKLKHIETKGTLAVVFVSNDAIRKINREWRGKDAPTDVISFPLDSSQFPSAKDLPWELGEIYISVEKAKEQAINFGHTLDRELAFLFVHGFLHVLGFDHETKLEEKEMFGRQKIVLKTTGFLK